MPEALADGGPPVPLILPPAPKDAHFLRFRRPAKIPHKREPAGRLTTRGASNPDNVRACNPFRVQRLADILRMAPLGAKVRQQRYSKQ